MNNDAKLNSDESLMGLGVVGVDGDRQVGRRAIRYFDQVEYD